MAHAGTPASSQLPGDSWSAVSGVAASPAPFLTVLLLLGEPTRAPTWASIPCGNTEHGDADPLARLLPIVLSPRMGCGCVGSEDHGFLAHCPVPGMQDISWQAEGIPEMFAKMPNEEIKEWRPQVIFCM